MNAERVTELLETRWQALQVELGERWGEFAGASRDIVANLPDAPDPDALACTADDLIRLLARYEYGCKLLRDHSMIGDDRLVPAPSDVMAEAEHVQQICNRLRVLLALVAAREAPSGVQGAQQSPAGAPRLPTRKNLLG